MATFRLLRDDARDLAFTGTRIARRRRVDGFGPSALFRDWCIYRTSGGTLIGSRETRRLMDGVQTFAAIVAATEADLTNWFGYSEEARKLFEEAGIDPVDNVA